MNDQNLIVYKFQSLYHVLKELSPYFNFKIVKIENEKTLNIQVSDLKNYVIVTKNKNLNFSSLILVNNLPINIFWLIEKKMTLLFSLCSSGA